uniref:Gypsy retrotransposon integrase-like protein 1 n=3 Tax=Micrurus spixii TaxID=129469 RepID=A0A2D4LY82_9SAUR
MDHRNLEALQKPRRLSPKQARWALYFKRFNFKLKYIPGGNNFMADTLSRLPQYQSLREIIIQPLIGNKDNHNPESIARLQHVNLNDIHKATAQDTWLWDNKTTCSYRNGLAWQGDKLYVPEVCRTSILQICHDDKQAGHFGFLKTLHLIRRPIFLPISNFIDVTNEKPKVNSIQEWSTKIKECWQNVKTALERSSERVKDQIDKKRVLNKTFRVGDKVFLSTKNIKIKFCNKLGPKYIGPFPIEKIINPVTVKLTLPKWLGRIHPVFHINLLKECIARDTSQTPIPNVPQNHMEIDKILNARKYRNHMQYLVRWKGYPEAEASWVKAKDINANKLIKQFHERHPEIHNML